MSTAAGLIFGTTRYISPEAAQGEQVSPAGDVYSIAMMFYEMLCGRTPFEADQAVALLVQQIHDAPPPLKTMARASYVPDPIAAVVMRNLSKRPEGRAENAREFGRELLEAAVASGLHAHDILARPGMTGAGRIGRASTPEPPAAASRDAARDAGSSGEHRLGRVAPTVYDALSGGEPEARAPGLGERAPSREVAAGPGADGRGPVRTEIGDLSPPPVATAVGPGPWSSAGGPPASRRGTPSPSGVEATMGEQQQPPSSVTGASRPGIPAGGTALAAGRTPTPAGVSAQASARTEPHPSGPRLPAGSSQASLYGDGGFSRHDAATRGRVLAILVGCFVASVIGLFVAARAGLLGFARAPAPTLDSVLAHANDALMHQRWDTPRGDNVRDTTDEGLARWPHEPQFLRVRALACNEVVKAARARRDEGELGDALHLAKLAYQFDPSDDAAQKLAAELEAQAQSPPDDFVPPLASAPVHAFAGAPLGPANGRVSLETSNPKPAVGQGVDFSAHMAGATSGSRVRVEGPSFHVSGPGVAPATALETVDDGAGGYRTTMTFLQPGRFELSFGGRADGAAVRATRIVQVAPSARPGDPGAAASKAGEAKGGDVKPDDSAIAESKASEPRPAGARPAESKGSEPRASSPPPPPPPASEPLPAPPASAKWL
jgi:serine/threonine-protein kinase